MPDLELLDTQVAQAIDESAFEAASDARQDCENDVMRDGTDAERLAVIERRRARWPDAPEMWCVGMLGDSFVGF
jgi:hypothetical protein